MSLKRIFITRKMSQLTSTVFMVRPAAFGYNEEAAKDNTFQVEQAPVLDPKKKAKEEFDFFVSSLQKEDIGVEVLNDKSHSPDAPFPNNWVSFHSEEKKVVVYSMKCINRRLEKKALPEVQSLLGLSSGWSVLDLSHYEEKGEYLEGTGSMVLDRVNKLAYACKSHRTHPKPMTEFCEVMGYKPVVFEAILQSTPIYHTNVMMSVGEKVAVVCFDVIKSPEERKMVRSYVEGTGKSIVEISEEQVKNFAGNIIQVKNGKDEPVMVMSTRAFESLDSKQISGLHQYGKILHVPLPVIETLGGGSARCMIAEVFR